MPHKDPEVRRAYMKRYDHDRSGHRVRYNKKYVRLTFNPRKGVCSECGYKGLTHMHHDEYYMENPLAQTRELCPGCHNKTRDYKNKLRDSMTGRFIHSS